MNTRAKTILMAVAAATATAALNSQAADQSAWFEQQREMTDGNPTSTFVPTPARTRQATPHQLAEIKWLAAERTREGGVLPYPFPLPEDTAVAQAPSTPAAESAQFETFENQVQLTDGAVPTVTPSEHVIAGGGSSSQVR
jgi:NifB/MoaA-like Fe-S oxidoreductase